MSAPLGLELRFAKRPTDRSLAGPFYRDVTYFCQELDRIWHRDWVFAAHDCELADAGAFVTLQVGEYPVLLVRGADGGIAAFHNVCRHRGARICAAAHGSVSRFKCRYHQWTYDLEGRLTYARDMPEGFDPKWHGLRPLHCQSVAGYLFVCVAAEAPDFAPFRAAVTPYLAPHRLDQAKVALSCDTVMRGNWKLVWENNRECYHCAGSHPELCQTFPLKPTPASPEAAGADPETVAHWRHCEAMGLASRFHLAASGQYRATRIPLRDDAESFTLTGKPAVRRPLNDMAAGPRLGSMLTFHYPSLWNHVLADHALSFRVLPLGPMETQVTTKWLVHRDAVEGVDYELDTLRQVWDATNAQDRELVEEVQRGVNSPAYEPGPFSPAHESGVAQFLDWYAGAMASPDA